MKAHEETWELTEDWVDDDGKRHTNDVINGSSTEVFLSASDSYDRLRLAAAAPEMARLLLELQWAGDEGGYDGRPCCPCCYALPPEKVHRPSVRIDAYTRTEARDEILYGKHSDDCRLVAVLRKAGVLEIAS